MSDESASEASPGALERAYRTVTPSYEGRPDAEMDVVGWTILLGIVLLLVPFLPFIALVWLLSKALELVAPSEE